jgi:hypothetical protein
MGALCPGLHQRKIMCIIFRETLAPFNCFVKNSSHLLSLWQTDNQQIFILHYFCSKDKITYGIQ